MLNMETSCLKSVSIVESFSADADQAQKDEAQHQHRSRLGDGDGPSPSAKIGDIGVHDCSITTDQCNSIFKINAYGSSIYIFYIG